MKIKVVLCSVLFVFGGRNICLTQGKHSGDGPVGDSSIDQWHKR